MKQFIPLLIASISGIVLILSFFVPEITPTIRPQTWGETVNGWFTVLAAMAYVLGAANLAKIHLKKISDRKPGWGFSAVTLIAFFGTLAVGLFKLGSFPSPQFPNTPWAAAYDEEGTFFWWIYEYAMNPLMATIFAILAFFVASAAFRAFRAKNVEATLLLATAFIILLGRTYAGSVLTDWLPDWLSGLRLGNLSVTIGQVFLTAGNRAIMIGIALGVAATSLKIILGMDRSYIGSSER